MHYWNQTIFRGVFQKVMTGVLLLSCLVISGNSVFATQGDLSATTDVLNQARTEFYKGRKMFYNSEAQTLETANVLNGCKEMFAKLPEGYDKYYWQAQLEFVLGEMAELNEEKESTVEHYTESGNLIRKALKYKPKSSEGNRIFADTIMRLMKYKGAVYLMGQGPHAYILVNNAVQFDKKNYAAINSLAIYFLNAPGYGGGSVDNGITALFKAMASKDEFDNFITYVWLMKAFHLKKNNEEETKYYNKALEIYPNSQKYLKLVEDYTL